MAGQWSEARLRTNAPAIRVLLAAAPENVNARHKAGHDELQRQARGAAYFGCGTIRIYGFGDFQPCG
jgi:hypothetical protein